MNGLGKMFNIKLSLYFCSLLFPFEISFHVALYGFVILWQHMVRENPQDECNVIVFASKERMRCFKPKDQWHDSQVFEDSHAPDGLLAVGGYEQESETEKTVLQILYTDFFFSHSCNFFFLKKLKHVKPKCTIHCFLI